MCLAIWLSFSARTTTDRVLVVVPPIAAFVAAGLEHSIANVYFLVSAATIRAFAPDSFWVSIGKAPGDFPAADWSALATNLAPVTMGNIVGGGVLVGAFYWFVFLRPRPAA